MRPLDILLGILVAALWGGNFVSSKIGAMHFTPFLFTALRYAVVAALLLPFVKRPPAIQLRRIAGLAFVLGTLHIGLIVSSLKAGLNVATCALITQLGVPFSCLLGAIFLDDRLGPWRLFGMIVAFIGIAIVAGNPDITAHPRAFFIALFSSFCWGWSNILLKRIEGVGVLQISAWMGFFATPMLLVMSALFEQGQWQALSSVPLRGGMAVAYTALGSTILAYSMWYHLMRRHPVSMVAPFSLLTPIFGIAAGQLFFTEALTWQVLAGGAITIAGVGVIILRRPKLAMVMEEA